MGVVIIAVVSALVTITILFIRLKIKILLQMKRKEVIPIYDDIINLAEIIDPKTNVAYETSSQPERDRTISV